MNRSASSPALTPEAYAALRTPIVDRAHALLTRMQPAEAARVPAIVGAAAPGRVESLQGRSVVEPCASLRLQLQRDVVALRLACRNRANPASVAAAIQCLSRSAAAYGGVDKSEWLGAHLDADVAEMMARGGFESLDYGACKSLNAALGTLNLRHLGIPLPPESDVSAAFAQALLDTGSGDAGLASLAKARDAFDRFTQDARVHPSEIEKLHMGLVVRGLDAIINAPGYGSDAAVKDAARLAHALALLESVDTSELAADATAKLQRSKRDLDLMREVILHRGHPPGVQGLRRIVEAAATVPGHGLPSLGSQYTTYGISIPFIGGPISSFGQGIGRLLHLPADGLRWVGRRMRKSEDGGVSLLGKLVKGCANLLGGVASATGGLITFSEAIVANVGGGALRFVGATVLTLAAGLAKSVGLVSGSASRAGDQIWDIAKAVARAPWLVKGAQQPLPLELHEQVLALEKLSMFTGTTDPAVRAKGPPSPYSKLGRDEIPRSLLRKEDGGTAQVANLRFDSSGRLTYSSWSGVCLEVFRFTDPQTNEEKLHLHFVGTKKALKATVKEDLAGSLGIGSASLDKVEAVVGELIRCMSPPGADGKPDLEMGRSRIQLSGHSLGGMLASWGAHKHGVPAICFNALGLHARLRDELGTEVLNRGKVIYVNSEGDWLSQRVESRRTGFTAGSQVGPRFVVEGAGGHSLLQSAARLEEQLIRRNYPG